MAAVQTPAQPRSVWVRRSLVGVGVLVGVALLAALVIGLKSLLGAPTAAKRQVAKITILPDTPPPPPPPKEEKKPEPKDDLKEAPRPEVAKADVPKAAQENIKMEGAAGDGPSAFGAGTVSSEYKGGAPLIGAAGGPVSNSADRAQGRFYANAVRQLLHDEIQKNLAPEAGELVASFSVWIDPDGSIKRFELTPTGDATRDTDLRAAFDQTRRLHLPAHPGLAQPLRFKLTLRPA